MAKRIRPDLLLTTNVLSTKVQKPSEDDNDKLKRMLRYLYGTKHLCMHMNFIENDTRYYCYIDASLGVHQGVYGHTGMVLMFGGAAILCKSTKQKIVVKSTAEGELVALSDMAGCAIHGRNFLYSLGIENQCIIYQDNKATISMISNENINDKSKHIKMRYYWLKEHVKSGEVSICYMDSGNMLADILTKPLQGKLFIYLRNKLLNKPR